LESEGKTPLERLVERADRLLTVLNHIAEDLREVVEKLKAAAPAEPAPLTVETVASAFPDGLRALLKFEDRGDFIMIMPSGFLGPENFAKVAEVVRNRLGGEYVSAGKSSHFRVPKKQATSQL